MSDMFIARIFACAALACAGTLAHADTALTSGQSAAVSLSGNGITSNYYIDVDGSAQSLTVSVNGSGGDVNLFVRYGTPFPEQDSSVAYPTIDEFVINDYAHYHSISSTSVESVTILPEDRFPLKAGRWYIVVANDSSSAASGTLTATESTSPPVGSITFDFQNPRPDASDPTSACDDSFWTDTTAATPVGGNPGTTLGDQRKNALNYAGQQLVQQLGIHVQLIVHACGAHLGGDKNSAILAHAGPTEFLYDTPEFPVNSLYKKYTWYPSTIAVRLGGASLCGVGGGACDGTNNEVMEAVFNEDIGQSTVIGGENFYYGYTPGTTGSGTLDFISIAMHEMTHGLGFIGLVNTDSTQGPIGAKAGLSTSTPGVIAYDNVTEGPYDDIYDDSVAIVQGGAGTYQPFLGYEVNGTRDAARATAMTSGPVITAAGTYNPGIYTGLRWDDPIAAASSVNIHAGESVPNNFPSLYAPCDETKTSTCNTQPSSTLSHTVQANDMMNAFYSDVNLRSMGLAVPMLAPLGWSNAVASSPTFPTPITGNWFDVTHSGHGFDFQLAAHDAVHGDIYALTFYTYTSAGTPEWYQATGNLIDGVFVPTLDALGNTWHRIIYQTSQTSILSYSLDSSVTGSVVVDFNQASTSPVCRNVDRSGAPQTAVMYWDLGGSDTAMWCMQPILPISGHATPDYNGMWFATSDPGWGFELVDVATGGSPAISVVMYLPGANGSAPFWLIGSGTLQGNTVSITLNEATNGYCRTCAPPASQTFQQIGTMTMSFNGPNSDGTYTTGSATISVSYPGGGSFNRNNIPITMITLPTGK